MWHATAMQNAHYRDGVLTRPEVTLLNGIVGSMLSQVATLVACDLWSCSHLGVSVRPTPQRFAIDISTRDKNSMCV